MKQSKAVGWRKTDDSRLDADDIFSKKGVTKEETEEESPLKKYLHYWKYSSKVFIFCGHIHSFLYKQLELGPSLQSCLYVQDFQGSKLLSVCLVVWSNKWIVSEFQWLFNIHRWHFYSVSQRSKQFLWNS